MFPAARIGDPITHDLLAPSGAITVPAGPPTTIIEGLPAAHVGCSVACTGAISAGLAHPPPPSPVPIITGSMTVLINNMPAARWVPSGDMSGCLAQLGDVKLLGTRRTFIGGATTGIAGMAIVRNPDGSISVGNNIRIEGSPEFQAKVLQDLVTIANTPSSDPSRAPAGLTTLQNIDGGRHTVTITETPGGNSTNFNGTDAQDPATGSDSTVNYNPDSEPPTAADPSVNRPADVGLHHELAHADHASQGTMDLNTPAPNPNNPHVEEENTINWDNEYRDDRGIPTRADHTVL